MDRKSSWNSLIHALENNLPAAARICPNMGADYGHAWFSFFVEDPFLSSTVV